ncbi:hypothetical protein SAMN02745245_00654 [Anaerosphaera aminiphila DSM 21120]|uniref:ABC-2 family transporter protein n=1 Tax=Anaerosphaera aminiphila DSM 21120 TaxID=1120995 RepID=A0A1M5QLT8_9FIRM|nr:hypothetical protein [Anaerosphaera aminiphila]SHH14948.1 hypothetical protein SAMN02745245_00654 [Anaerosphaera aminiphila DSM 21120]
MKSNFLKRKTIKSATLVIGSYLVSLTIFFLIFMGVSILLKLDAKSMFREFNYEDIAQLITMLVSLYVFYIYFGSTFNYAVKKGETRKKFIAYAIILVVVISFVVLSIHGLIYVHYEIYNAEYFGGSYAIDFLSYMRTFLTFAVAMTLVGKYKSGYVAAIILFFGFITSMIMSVKEMFEKFKFLINIVMGFFSGEEASSIAIIGGVPDGTVEQLSRENIELMVKFTIIMFLIMLIWLILSNKFRSVRD